MRNKIFTRVFALSLVVLLILGAFIAFAAGQGKAIKGADKAIDIFRGVGKGAEVAKGASKAGKIFNEGSKIRDAEEVVKIPVKKLYGHATDDPVSLFRAGAKTHQTNPIEVIKIGEDYMINDGVGRTMRAIKAGESSVNAKVVRTYPNIDDLNQRARVDDMARVDKHWWDKIVTKIDDLERWKRLSL